MSDKDNITIQEYDEQIQILLDDKKQLQWEINQLKEALRKCSPWSNYNLTSYTHCYYCKCFHMDNHKDDCEYVKLISESEDE